MSVKVALSGAGGNVGRILRVELQKRGVDLRSAGGSKPLEPLHDGEDVMHGDLKDEAVVDRLLTGVDVLVHMAGTSVERPLPEIIQNNLVGLHQVYEGARRHKVRRIVFASSNHAFGMYSDGRTLRLDAAYRPDGFYGLSRSGARRWRRMYWDKHGIEGVSLRIGTTMGRPPENFRQLSTWMGTDDLVQLIMRSIEARRRLLRGLGNFGQHAQPSTTCSEGNAIGYRRRRTPKTGQPRSSSSPTRSIRSHRSSRADSS